MNSTLFFDLDGTLSNPKVGIVESIRYALLKLNLDCPDGDELTWCIGPPLLESFAELAGAGLASKAVEYYRERFSRIGWKENEVYPEIEGVLQQLVSSGNQLFVATSKPHIYAEKIVTHFGLQSYFGRVFGAELDGTRSAKEDLLRYAIREVGCGTAGTMIGDRKYDIAGAKANGLLSLGVTYGFGSKEELQRAGADSIADTPGGILKVLKE